jgi:hypothetical protein
LFVHITGVAWGVAQVEVNFGGEANASTSFDFADGGACNIGTPFDFAHEFVCPGTFEIVVSDVNDPIARYTVVVSEPVNLIAPKAEVLPFNVFLYTAADIRPSTITRTTVQWGDGRSEDFVWLQKTGGFVTPTHDYLAGQYTATVTHHYGAGYCSSDPSYSTTFQIPLPATPVKATTWGSVKMMYRN